MRFVIIMGAMFIRRIYELMQDGVERTREGMQESLGGTRANIKAQCQNLKFYNLLKETDIGWVKAND